ncbi:MAG: asparagine synthase-related protein [Janthinobacterium lividum]
MSLDHGQARAALEQVLRQAAPLAVAVSGGVDSMTLASLAQTLLGPASVLMVHATSPAVPPEATARVQAAAAAARWTLRVIDAGEFADPAYRANPVNRCFFCKINLYGAVAAATSWQIVSGANMDDLGEYRPGLDAAREHAVRHPFVEAGYSKAAVRALARELGLGAIAELPAAPCLSSRIETGIPVEPDVLRFVHGVERLVGDRLGAGTGARRAVRCRVRAGGVVVELDPESLARLDADARGELGRHILAAAPPNLAGQPLAFEPYRTGSAFLVAGR